MNLNPFGPPFANMGPSGVDLFFGRKWWYYNQVRMFYNFRIFCVQKNVLDNFFTLSVL